jgi:hypothetical protein
LLGGKSKVFHLLKSCTFLCLYGLFASGLKRPVLPPSRLVGVLVPAVLTQYCLCLLADNNRNSGWLGSGWPSSGSLADGSAGGTGNSSISFFSLAGCVFLFLVPFGLYLISLL